MSSVASQTVKSRGKKELATPHARSGTGFQSVPWTRGEQVPAPKQMEKPAEQDGTASFIDDADEVPATHQESKSPVGADGAEGDENPRTARPVPQPRRTVAARNTRDREIAEIAAGARPFRRPDGEYSVSIAVNGHRECHALESGEVVRWLTRNYYESAGRLPSSAALAATIRLAAHADIAGTAEADFVRVGCNQSGSSLFLDLGDSTWRAIEIQAIGWQVVDWPGVHFRRAAGQRRCRNLARWLDCPLAKICERRARHCAAL